jgi:hypothetical protein
MARWCSKWSLECAPYAICFLHPGLTFSRLVNLLMTGLLGSSLCVYQQSAIGMHSCLVDFWLIGYAIEFNEIDKLDWLSPTVMMLNVVCWIYLVWLLFLPFNSFPCSLLCFFPSSLTSLWPLLILRCQYITYWLRLHNDCSYALLYS